MKIYLFKTTAGLFLLYGLLFNPLKAQQIASYPYFCGFETQAEISDWTLVNDAGLQNQWVIGTAVKSSGKQSLYISADGGATAGYANQASGMGVYATLALQTHTVYDISFDWRSPNEEADYLYVAWIDDTDAEITASWTETLPQSIAEGTAVLYQIPYALPWKNYSFSVNSGNNTEGRLLFYWSNNGATSTPPGACVDNIQINKRGVCDKPDSLNVTFDQGVKVTWKGSATSYELQYKLLDTVQWTQVNNITGNSYTIPDLDRGVYAFWVRAICGNDTSMWSVYTNYIIGISSNTCINYVDLYSPAVTATYNTITTWGLGTHTVTGIYDNGYDSNTSRHTIHWVQDEYDLNTGNKLRTIPPDEVASVRLGNSSVKNADKQSIAYDYTVDSTASILLLKYAVVVNEPVPRHESDDQAGFNMEILNSSGQRINAECGMLDFVAGYTTDSTWNKIELSDVNDVLWKDWTTIGLNLQEYIGQTIKIKLTTSNCSFTNGHYGYAYFTLDCASATLSGLTCGDNTVEAVGAPEGFNYEWRKLTDSTGTIVATDRMLRPLENDTATYICKIISKENLNCYFELTASLAPQFPKAEFSHTLRRTGCENRVTFNDKSYVYIVKTLDDGTEQEIKTNRKIEEYYWDFGNGETSTLQNPLSIVYNAPVTSADTTYYVSLRVTINKGGEQCDSIYRDTITVYPIGPTSSNIKAGICKGEVYNFNGRPLTDAGIYEDALFGSSGCDSTVFLTLNVYDTYSNEIRDTVCLGSTYNAHGFVGLAQSGNYSINPKSIHGCDSIIRLRLTVLDELKVEISQPSLICADDAVFSVSYQLLSGESTSGSVSFNGKAKDNGFLDFSFPALSSGSITIPLPGSVTPSVYNATLVFRNQRCETEAYPIFFIILYPDSIITQRWNDILSVRNSVYNGGYEFSSYQWYKGGVEIGGATKSYLYVPEGLDFNAAYAVNLVQQGQTESIMSCGFIPEYIPGQITVYPTAVKRGMSLTAEVPVDGIVTIYNIMGLKYGETNLYEGRNQLTAPDVTGIYLYQIRLSNNEERIYRISVSE